MECRVENQLRYYSKSGSEHRNRHYTLRISGIVASLLVTIFAVAESASNTTSFALLIGILGAMVAGFESLSTLGKYHERWIKYRTTAEALKAEKFHYQMSAGPIYSTIADQHERDRKFCQRFEAIIASENAEWASIQLSIEHSTPAPQPKG